MDKYLYEYNEFQCFVAHHLGNFLHMHNEIELIYVYKGSMRAFCDCKEYIVGAGEFIIIFPNKLHKYEELEPVEYLLAIFDKSLFPTLAPIFTNMNVLTPVVSKECMHAEVTYGLRQIYDREKLQGDCNVTRAYLLIMVDAIIKALPVVEKKDKGTMEWFDQVLCYMNDHFKERFLLEKLAKEVGVSKYHISRNFNEKVGCSMIQYINGLRVGEAVRLIEATEMPIVDLAYECGFESLTSFFRLFKMIKKETPKQYRNKIRQTQLHTQLKQNNNI